MSLLSKSFSLAVLLFVTFCLFHSAAAQTAKVDHTSSVSGRVTVNGQPAAGVLVTLLAGQRQGMRDEPLARTTTDAEGRFHLSRLAAGSYRVNLLAPGYINADDNPYGVVKTVNLEENDAIDNIEFSLKRGGVITGTVTDANHQPVIEASVSLRRFGPSGQMMAGFEYSGETDDRGVYRIFGLPAGHYKASVKESFARQGASAALYPATYYPNTREEAKAELVEVTDGGEVTDIDIHVGEMPKTFAIYGRMIDAQTGKPVAGLRYGLGVILSNENRSSTFSTYGNLTDAKGEFKIGSLALGRYSIFAANSADSNIYSEPVIVEITDADAKVEIKTHRGASIHGDVIIEGTNDAKILAQLSETFLFIPNANQPNTPNYSSTRLNVNDGSFHFNGLRGGKLMLEIMNFGNPTLAVSRLEKDGVEIKSIDLKEGEQINDLRLFLTYGKGIIRGQVTVQSGDFPDLSALSIAAKRKGDTTGRGSRQGGVDIRGRFVMEGLLPGEYELSLGTVNRKGFDALARMQRVNLQTVTVTNDAESQVTIVLQAKN